MLLSRKFTSVAGVLSKARLLSQLTCPSLQRANFVEALRAQGIPNPAVYCGYDPTADSLHVGHLASVVSMVKLQEIGLKPIFLVGGATGLIGDPSGKEAERPQLQQQEVNKNAISIEQQLASLYLRLCGMRGIEPLGLVVNNRNFYEDKGILEFLEQVGRHVRINQLLRKQSIKARLSASEEGMSLNEFVYTVFQGYDFLQLFKRHGCVLQLGGSDQYGNIVSGISLIRRVARKQAFGATLALLKTADGKKLGKSEGNAVGLSSDPDQLFHYLINLPDTSVEDLFYQLTFDQPDPSQPIQAKKKALAQAVIASLGHPDWGRASAEEKYFSIQFDQIRGLGRSEADNFFSFAEKRGQRSLDDPLLEWLRQEGMSKSQVRRQVAKGGVRANGRRVQSPQGLMAQGQLIGGKYLVVRFGRKRHFLMQLRSDVK